MYVKIVIGLKQDCLQGNVVKCLLNIPHWHGAAPNEKFIQIAITNTEMSATVWLQAVTNGEYNSPNNK